MLGGKAQLPESMINLVQRFAVGSPQRAGNSPPTWAQKLASGIKAVYPQIEQVDAQEFVNSLLVQIHEVRGGLLLLIVDTEQCCSQNLCITQFHVHMCS